MSSFRCCEERDARTGTREPSTHRIAREPDLQSVTRISTIEQPRVLVQPILRSDPQRPQVAVRQRSDENRGPPDVEDGILEGHRRRQPTSALIGPGGLLGDPDHQGCIERPLKSHDGAFRNGDDATVEARSDVVGMAVQFRGDVEDPIGVAIDRSAISPRVLEARQRGTCDTHCATESETTPDRYRRTDPQVSRATRSTMRNRRGVRIVDPTSPIGKRFVCRARFQTPTDGDAESVEARPDVGRRTRNADDHVGVEAAAC